LKHEAFAARVGDDGGGAIERRDNLETQGVGDATSAGDLFLRAS
jgi:hypothetical protein